MKILVVGATGLIGVALATRLAARGHAVVRAARQSLATDAVTEFLEVDFSQVPDSAWWAPHLVGVDVVVNAVGIFQEGPNQTFDAIHTQAPLALFTAAADARVRLVVQLSALGADEHAATPFHLSKRAADDALRKLPVNSVIVQPSLVYDPEGASATLFNRLAALPVLLLPATDAPVQPLHLRDLIDAITHLIERPPSAPCTVRAVGPEALTLESYLLKLRRSMGMASKPFVMKVPLAWAERAARAVSAVIPGKISFADPDALSMLARGNSADPSDFLRHLGRPATLVEGFLSGDQRGQVRERVEFLNLLVWMRASVATVWIATGALSLGLYPVEQSLQLLDDFGLEGPLAWGALYLGAILDLALGVAVLLAPRRFLPSVCRAQIAVIVTYTLLISLRLPHWWLHPFGPVLKNLPLLVGIAMLSTFSRRT